MEGHVIDPLVSFGYSGVTEYTEHLVTFQSNFPKRVTVTSESK